MATEEVGIRLSLQGRREAAAGLQGTTRELEGVADAAEDVDAAGRDAARGLEKATDKRFAKGFAALRRGAGGVARTLGRGLVAGAKAGAVALGVTAIAAGGLSVKAIGLASDANETGSAFSTVLGPAAKGVQKDLDRLSNRFGIYNTELQGAATGFATLGKQAGERGKDLSKFSTKLVRAGLDLGSFYNASPEEAFAAIQSGLTGEAESLKRFNIFMSDAALNAFAAKKGISETTQEMSEQEKVALRQAFILAHLGDAQGDLARTSSGFANQQRGAQGRIKALLTTIGGPLTTAATGAFRGLNSILKVAMGELESRMPALEAGAQKLSRRFAKLGKTWANDLPGAIDSLVTRWGELKSQFASFTGGSAGDELGTLKDNMVALGPALREASTQLPGISDALSVANVVTGYLAEHTDELAKYMPWLIAGYAALKVSQLAANIVLAASLPMKIMELITNRQLTASNRALVASRAQVTAATSTNTAAIGANTAAERVGILTRARSAAGMVLMAAKTAIVRGATMAWTGVQWVLNAALTANPIGLVIAAIALLVGGVVLAYKKSDTFRGIVDKLWAVLKIAWDWIKKVGAAVGTWIVGKFQDGIAKVGSIRDAIAGFIDKIKSAVGWVKDLGSKISNMPGMGLLGDVAGGIGGLVPGLAHGGAVTPGQPVTIGERGRETFLPTAPGIVLPNPTTTPDVDDMLGDAGDVGRPLVVQLVTNGRVMAEQVVGTLQGRLARA